MRILLTEPEGFSPVALEKLRSAGHRVGRVEAAADFDEEVARAEGVIVRLGVRWTAARLAAAPKLRWLLTPTTGLDHIDLEAAAAQGVAVVSLRGLPGLEAVTSTPEHAFALLLALVRRIPGAVAHTWEGGWDRDAFQGRELRGKQVGVIGLGRTGTAFAGYCQAFGMSVRYYDPYVKGGAWPGLDSLAALAAWSDVISVHVHLTPETAGMLDAAFFQGCGRSPWLVNTSRGDLVDEGALLEALQSGRISGAAVDVVQGEPEKGGVWSSPLRDYAKRHANLLVTPHIAGCTLDAMRHTEEMIVDAFLQRLAVD